LQDIFKKIKIAKGLEEEEELETEDYLKMMAIVENMKDSSISDCESRNGSASAITLWHIIY